MNNRGPSPAARITAHAAVGLVSVIVAGYVLVGMLGLGKNKQAYYIGSALLGMYVHQQMDAPVAKLLSSAGL